jgi:P-type E1-E2 ATPase
MLELDVPGFKQLRIDKLVLDFNGTISLDGELIPGVADRLIELGEDFAIIVVTSDTFGTAKEQMKDLAQVRILETANHRDEKRSIVSQLGDHSVVAIGNGRNDVKMLESASIGIAVCQGECASSDAVQAADIVCRDIREGLDLLRFPRRLLATLRA